jgi:hypothetical protein
VFLGPFEKFIRSTKVRTLEGSEYVRKVSENCIAHMKSEGTYGDAEEKAIKEFREAFKDQFFPPGTAAFYRQSPNGALGVSIINIIYCMYLNIHFNQHNLIFLFLKINDSLDFPKMRQYLNMSMLL